MIKLSYTGRDLGAHLAKKERRRKLLKALAAIGAVGAGAYAVNRFARSEKGNEPAVVPVPAPTPSSGYGLGKKVLAGLAVPAGLGLAVAGGRFAHPAISRPLKGVFGDIVARAARKNGIAHVWGKHMRKELMEGMEQYLKVKNPKVKDSIMRRMGLFFDEKAVPKGKVKLFDFNPASGKVKDGLGAVSSRRANILWDNKEFQRQMLERAGVRGAMPTGLTASQKKNFITDMKYIADMVDSIDDLPAKTRAEVLSDPNYGSLIERAMTHGVDDDLANELLNKSTGKRWFFKAKGNTAGRLPGEKFFEDADDIAAFDPRDFLKRVDVVEYMPSRKFSPMHQKFLDSRLGKWLAKHSPVTSEYGKGSMLPRHAEYRIHVVNGKVIPFATSEKWDPFMHFSRFTNKEKQSLERQIQGHMDRLMEYQAKHPKMKGFKPWELDLRKQVFGLDVGVGPDGKAIIYEFNPSMPDAYRNGSGQLLHPDVLDAVSSAVKGRMPAIQKLQLLLGGAGVAGGAGMAAGGVNGLASGDRRK